MSDANVDPKIQAVVNDAVATEQLAVAVAKAIKTQGVLGVAAMAPRIASTIEKDIADVQAALPVIKAGYTTTEFWLSLAGLVFVTIWPLVTKSPMPLDVTVVVGAIISVYTAIRGLVKVKTIPS